jgi:MinD superfamily P-loop ATPase
MKEIVVLSGKGGTGKTSIAAVFATLMNKPVVVDCDVDAANLHLLLCPVIEETYDFVEGAKARVDAAACTGCGQCIEACRFDAIHLIQGVATVDMMHCEGCAVCARICSEDAISLKPQLCGKWFLSHTKNGPMVYARLGPGQDNSGKQVSSLRGLAKAIARQDGASWILVDGPPGTGCPVISSLTGVDYVVMVTEPTMSGFADLKRTIAVADHFHVPVGIVINKEDINADVAARIEGYAAQTGRDSLGRIGYDPAFTRAQLSETSVLEEASASLRGQLKDLWSAVEHAVLKKGSPFTQLQ